jgi:gliding motility-associated-like protein
MKRFSTILFICLTCLFKLEAQNLLTNNNSLVVINANVPFTVEGGVSNSGLIHNEGALRLFGDWANSGDYSSVSGTFSLLGENQIFEPGEPTYNNLSINSGGVAITNDLHISESLELINGIVSLVPGSKILMLSDAFISGGNENSYIDGALFTARTGTFTFPVGTEFEYLPVTLTNIHHVDSVGVQAFGSTIEATIPSELDAFSTDKYWQIIGGGSFSSKGVTFPISNESFLENIDEAVVAYTREDGSLLKVLGVPIINGTEEAGSITLSSLIFPGNYVLADKSVGGPPISVVNVVTSLQDGKHDFLRIENIEFYEGNLVEIFDRNGVKVFEMERYNNTDRVFRGSANVGSRGVLQTGSYYYTIKLTSSKREAGFIYVKN